MLKKKTLIILLAAVLLALALALVLIFVLGEGDPAKVDSDGDGIPDLYDQEEEDNLDGDNQVDIGDLIG